MAPFLGSDTMDTLKSKLEEAEAKIKELERRIAGGSSGSDKSSTPSESMRMILIGPPGAGM